MNERSHFDIGFKGYKVTQVSVHIHVFMVGEFKDILN